MTQHNKYLWPLLFLLFVSCTKERTGVVDFSPTPLHIVATNITPQQVNVDTDTTSVEPLGDDRFRITTSLAASLVRLAGGTTSATLSVTILKPRSNTALGVFELQPTASSGDTIHYASNVSFIVNRVDAGLYPFDFSARGTDGVRSNIIRRGMTIARANSKPEVAIVSAPDSVVRPSAGRTVFLLAVNVSDPDGYEDISEVYFRVISPTVSPIVPMYDSGDLDHHGDEHAGDGIFSVLVEITPANTLGPRELLFQARDFQGAVSDSVIHTFTIVEGS